MILAMLLQAVPIPDAMPPASGAEWLGTGAQAGIAWIAWKTYRLLSRVEARLEVLELVIFGQRKKLDPMAVEPPEAAP